MHSSFLAIYLSAFSVSATVLGTQDTLGKKPMSQKYSLQSGVLFSYLTTYASQFYTISSKQISLHHASCLSESKTSLFLVSSFVASEPFTGGFHLLLSSDQDCWVSLPCFAFSVLWLWTVPGLQTFHCSFKYVGRSVSGADLNFESSAFSASSYPLDILVITHLLLGS